MLVQSLQSTDKSVPAKKRLGFSKRFLTEVLRKGAGLYLLLYDQYIFHIATIDRWRFSIWRLLSTSNMTPLRPIGLFAQNNHCVWIPVLQLLPDMSCAKNMKPPFRQFRDTSKMFLDVKLSNVLPVEVYYSKLLRNPGNGLIPRILNKRLYFHLGLCLASWNCRIDLIGQ